MLNAFFFIELVLIKYPGRRLWGNNDITRKTLAFLYWRKSYEHFLLSFINSISLTRSESQQILRPLHLEE